MKFELYKDVKAFYGKTYDVLMRHEAQNLIPLGNIIIGNEGKDKTAWRDSADWFMAVITDETGIRLTAIMTPPWNITLYATDNKIDDQALSCLIQGIKDNGITVPGVITEISLAKRFAEAFSVAMGIKFTIHKNMRQYELKKVNPEIPVIGTLRLAEDKDMAFLPFWIEGFQHDCFGHPLVPKEDPEPYHYQIGKERLYILEVNGMPVSIASKNREMQSVCGVSQVYTPPYFRGKGYATSCVAALSRIILGMGFTKCVLYTDLDNPTSNSIYQKIGYVPICDSLEIKFEPG